MKLYSIICTSDTTIKLYKYKTKFTLGSFLYFFFIRYIFISSHFVSHNYNLNKPHLFTKYFSVTCTLVLDINAHIY